MNALKLVLACSFLLFLTTGLMASSTSKPDPENLSDAPAYPIQAEKAISLFSFDLVAVNNQEEMHRKSERIKTRIKELVDWVFN